jgi:hypothetical protein
MNVKWPVLFFTFLTVVILLYILHYYVCLTLEGTDNIANSNLLSLKFTNPRVNDYHRY